MAEIENAPNGENSSLAGTEALPVSGSQYTLISTIASYIRTLAQTFTNKTINLANNTLTGTTAEFNVALSDNAFLTLTGVETTTNKTLTDPIISDMMVFNGVEVYKQAATPASPTSPALWLETDTQIWWYYGTFASANRWVSIQRYSTGTASGLAGTTASVTRATFPAQSHGYNLYLETYYLRGFVITTNDGSNYWQFDLRKVSGSTNGGSGAGTILATVTTAAWSPDAWSQGSDTIDEILDGTSSYEIMFDEITKVMSPGNINNNVSVAYRLVHP